MWRSIQRENDLAQFISSISPSTLATTASRVGASTEKACGTPSSTATATPAAAARAAASLGA